MGNSTVGVLSVGMIEGGPGSPLSAFIWQIQEAINVQLVDEEENGYGLGVVFVWLGDAWDSGSKVTRVKVHRDEQVVEMRVAVSDELAWWTDEPRLGLLRLLEGAVARADDAARRAKVPFDATRYLDAMQGAAEVFDLDWRPHAGGLEAVRSAMPKAESTPSRDTRPWDAAAEFLADDQLVLTFPVSTKAEWENAWKLEEEVEAALGDDGLGFVDGNEIGEGTFALFLMGVDETRFEAVVRPVLARFGYGPESFTLTKGPVA
jgi:hypothetical protein